MEMTPDSARKVLTPKLALLVMPSVLSSQSSMWQMAKHLDKKNRKILTAQEGRVAALGQAAKAQARRADAEERVGKAEAGRAEAEARRADAEARVGDAEARVGKNEAGTREEVSKPVSRTL